MSNGMTPPVYKAKVWNHGSDLYTEYFRGSLIKIPAKGFIVMDEPDATAFLGEIPPPRVNADGSRGDDRKPLHMERILDVSVEKAIDAHVTDTLGKTCQICGYVAATPHGLKIHTASQHPNAEPAKKAD